MNIEEFKKYPLCDDCLKEAENHVSGTNMVICRDCFEFIYPRKNIEESQEMIYEKK